MAASDVDNPLLGLRGATNVFGPQKGVTDDRLQAVDALVERLAEATDKKVALAKGAGAAGGLGFGLLLLGATRLPGPRHRRGGRRAARAGPPLRPGDHRRGRLRLLLAVGQGALRGGRDRRGGAPALHRARRQVLVGSREMRALGVESAYSMVDLVGEEASFADPAGSLAALAERTARSWSR